MLARNASRLPYLAVSSIKASNRLNLIRTRAASYTSQSGLPMNTVVKFVPQQEAWIIERMGKFNRILEPGLNFLWPFIDSVKYVQTLKEMAIDIPKQSAITKDNVSVSIDGVLYLRVMDAYKASYNVEDPAFAITQLAQTTMRSELGKISLDSLFRERETLNIQIVEAVNRAAEIWGISCLRYEIRDIRLPQRVQEAMQMQVEAERKKRAAILESEGDRDSRINSAEGQKRSKILASEANKIEQINSAEGTASAVLLKARARAEALKAVSEVLAKGGADAASFEVAEQYMKAFSGLAKECNTLILPSNAADVGGAVAQGLSIFKSIMQDTSGKGGKISSDGKFSSHNRQEDVSEANLFDNQYFDDVVGAGKNAEGKPK